MRKIVIIYGLPCTGKSEISSQIITKFKSFRIRIDEIWESMFVKPQYTVEESEIVFAHLLEDLGGLIKANTELIIIEGVFASISRLELIESIAKSSKYSLVSILLFDKMDNLIKRNVKRNEKIENKITVDTLQFLNSKFNSSEFCNLSINTGKVSLTEAVELINKFL